MATQRLTQRLSRLKKSRAGRDRLHQELKSRKFQLEKLEDRNLMALVPPAILPSTGALLNNGATLHVAPQDLTFDFNDIVDLSTVANGIRLVRAGNDGVLDPPNTPLNLRTDIPVTPGFLGMGEDGRQIIMRFASTLPDDIYRLEFVGAGNSPLRDVASLPFNNGQNFNVTFNLDLGAQVVAVVPQPVRRKPDGTLSMTDLNNVSTANKIVVYFNNDDLAVPAPGQGAEDPKFYRLYVTKNTLDPNDDVELLPTSVVYDRVTDTATLTFNQVTSFERFFDLNPLVDDDGSRDPGKSFRLRVGTDEMRRATTPTQLLGTDQGSGFLSAFDLGTTLTATAQGASVQYAAAIDAQSYTLLWPGGGTEPGHRDSPIESHYSPPSVNPGDASGIQTQTYNFGPVLGQIPDGIGGFQNAPNFITDAQKQRAREIFELYSRYSGIQFVETANEGWIIGTGDLRAMPNSTVVSGIGGVLGIAGSGRAIMDHDDPWNDQFGFGSSPPGNSWFDTAMHEIGHLIGLGHTYDLPSHTVQGDSGGALQFNSPGAEPVFPGDHDIVHARHLNRPDSKDIDMYKFTLDGTGVFTAETFADRLPNSSNLDTALAIYREEIVNNVATRTLVARNDDYYSKDSFVELTLNAGTYYVGVSASGNETYDPAINDSGMGGTSQGDYELKFNFRKSATNSLRDTTTPANPNPAPAIIDNTSVAFDGDADGTPGGVHNFWFRAAAPSGQQTLGRARTIFVDRAYTGPSSGSLAQPFKQIDEALLAAQPYDIVRIVGNGGTDGNLATLSDNLAYHVGFASAVAGAAELRDGSSLNVPKDVTVMIEAGTIIQLQRAQIGVGSTSSPISSDRSGGSLQVLGTPNNRVYFTSYNESGANRIGADENTSTAPAAPGDWGGISFKADLDRADGRFVHEDVGVFLNYVNHADIRYGGGLVNINADFQSVNAIDLTDSRPSITHNKLTRNLDAAMAANPDSFEETNFQAPRYWPSFSHAAAYSPSGLGSPTLSASYTLDYDRVGPEIHHNTLVEVDNSTIDSIAFVGTVTTNASSDPRTAATIAHSVPAGNNRLLVVSVLLDGGQDVSSVTYGGVAMTRAIERDSGVNTGSAVDIWYLVAPAVGTSNIVVNFTAPVDPSVVTATNFTGVNQRNPIGAVVGADADTGTAISTSITTTAPGSVIFGAASAQRGASSPFFPLAGVTERWDLRSGTSATDDIGAWGGTRVAATPGTFAISATSAVGSGGDDWAIAAIEIKSLGSTVHSNGTNGLFIRTSTPAGEVVEELTVAGRFDDRDIVHVIQENLHITGTPGGATRESSAPDVTLVVPSVAAGGRFNAPVADLTVQYKLVDFDLHGNEGQASDTITVVVPAGSTNRAIRLDGLSFPAAGFVGRHLYRRTSASADFQLVGIVPAQLNFAVDTGAPQFGLVPKLRVLDTNIDRPRLDGSLNIDPAIVVKSSLARIDVGIGANLIAEGLPGLQVIFTSIFDDRYGAGGTFDTASDNSDAFPKAGAEGDWTGIFFGPDSKGSIDNAYIAFGGGLTRVEGNHTGFNVIEIREADVRIAHSKFEQNADGVGGEAPADRFGRGPNAPGTIFVRGAQPVIISNTFQSNEGALININVNALNSDRVVDLGRQTGSVDRMPGHLDNNGPLVDENRLIDNGINGMIVRGGTLTTEVVWDDTDIVHVLQDAINVPDLHVFGGIRLESSTTESLVVKSQGDDAGITATGRPLEIDDRIGGMLHVIGQPGAPVVMTSLNDCTVGAGFTPDGLPQNDTLNVGTCGPVITPNSAPFVDVIVVMDESASMGFAQTFSAQFILDLEAGLQAAGIGTTLGPNQYGLFGFGGASPITFGHVINVGAGGTVPFGTAAEYATATQQLVVNGGLEDGWLAMESALPNYASRPNSAKFMIMITNEDRDDGDFDPVTPPFFNTTLTAIQAAGYRLQGILDVDIRDNTGTTALALDAAQNAYTEDGLGGFTVTPNGVFLPDTFFNTSVADYGNMSHATGGIVGDINQISQSAQTAQVFSQILVGSIVVQAGGGSAAGAGDWEGLTIDQYAHDRNVETVLETESASGDGTQNGTYNKAQVLGELAALENGGDETLRLGYTVHGVINRPGDLDHYSFFGKPGTEVWIDIDRTWHALDPVIELVDEFGNVQARSMNSSTESLNNGTAENIARRMQKTPPYEGTDHYTTNPRDAGMRIILPGAGTKALPYHLRIRSAAGANVTGTGANQQISLLGVPTAGTFTVSLLGNSTLPIPYNADSDTVRIALTGIGVNATVTGGVGGPWNIQSAGLVGQFTVNTDNLVGGLTEGGYQLQVRLREVDEFGGATVRHADIRYATNGIRVLGQPTHSPLAGEHTETNDAANSTRGGAQNIGNLLTSDRGVLALSGNLNLTGTDVDWFRMEIQYGAQQGTSTEDWWSTIFDMDYGDGFGRPNMIFHVFNDQGQLVYSSRDSNIAEDRPNPVDITNTTDLSRGTGGLADPWIGPAEMRQGTYFIAIANDTQMPLEYNQFTQANAANPLVRIEPINSVARIVEDHVGSTGGSRVSTAETGFINVSVNTTSSAVVPWSLHDVTLYVSSPGVGPNATRLVSVDPFSGTQETLIGQFGTNVSDITLHPRGRMYTYSIFQNGTVVSDAGVGNYIQIDPATAAATPLSDDNIETYEQDPGNANVAAVRSNLFNNVRIGEGIHFRAMDIAFMQGVIGGNDYVGFAVGGRDELLNATNDPFGRNDPRSDFQNILYAFNPDSGVATGLQSSNRTGNGVLGGAGTQIVERGVLNTSVDSNPPVGGANVIQTAEATIVTGITTTSFNVMDSGYPLGAGRPAEIPTGNPSPTTFQITASGLTRFFEFDAGPEALIEINPSLNQFIQDGQAIQVNATRVEFDTGPTLLVQPGAVNTTNYPVGSTFSVTSSDPDPGNSPPDGGTLNFEFVIGAASTVVPGTIPVQLTAAMNPNQVATAIANAIDGQFSVTFTTDAVVHPTLPRVSLTNGSPLTDPMDDSDALETVNAPGLVVSGQRGLNGAPPAGTVRVRIEETSSQTDLIDALRRVNTAGYVTPMPTNTQPAASAAGGLLPTGTGTVQIGIDGKRLNFSGANTVANISLSATVFQTVGSSGGVGPAFPAPIGARVAVPFLAEDSADEVALRMRDAIQSVGVGAFLNAQANNDSVAVPGATVDSADAPLSAAAQAPGGLITGLATINGIVYAVTDAGGLFQVLSPTSGGAARLDYINTATDLVGIQFSGLTAGPRHVENGRYQNMLFAIANDGELYAIGTQGAQRGLLQPVFSTAVNQLTGQLEARTSVPTGVVGAHGVEFSNLDYNLWHTTPNRDSDLGHGINVTHDQSRVASTVPDDGGTSLYFGFESVVRNNVNSVQQYAPVAGANDVNFPGGAHGSVESNTFSLKGYSGADNPVLYFNYFLETEQAVHNDTTPLAMKDAFRVFVAGDDGVWHILSTNDSARINNPPPPIDDDFDFAPLRVQETWDNTSSWRQVRVPLADFAGQDNLRLRFDFSTAGSMNVGDYVQLLTGQANTPTNGDELRAVDGFWLRDEQSFDLTLAGTGSTAIPSDFENNDTIATAFQTNVDTGPFNGSGVLGNNAFADNEVDMYRMDLLAGQQVNLDLFADRLGSPLDGFLRVFDDAGAQLAFDDDTTGFDPFISFTAPTNGTYYVGVSSFNNRFYDPNVAGSGTNGFSTGAYQLRAALATATSDDSFVFDMGYTLVVPNGSTIPNNAQFTINAQTFQFVQGGGIVPGVRVIPYQLTDSPETLAAAIEAAILATAVSPVQRVSTGSYNAAEAFLGSTGNRLNLRGGAPGAVTGATSVTLGGTMPASFLEGAPGGAGNLIPIHSRMTRTEVREAIALVMAGVFAPNVTGAAARAQIKTHDEMIRLIGYRWIGQNLGPNVDAINQRPMGITTTLPGDAWGAFNASTLPDGTRDANFPGAQRAQNNTIEGVYIDDIIIGFAERGEMVTESNGANDTFTANPNAITLTNVDGPYTLEVRRAREAGIPNTTPGADPPLVLLAQQDTNDRLAASQVLTAPTGAQIFDGRFFTLHDGINSLTFEFNDLTIPGSGVVQGRVRIDYAPTDTNEIIAQRVVAAVNSTSVQQRLKIAAQLSDGALAGSTSNRVNLIGTISVPVTGGMTFTAMGAPAASGAPDSRRSQYGDRNLFRDQGQILLISNEISRSQQWGILVDNNARLAADGGTPHQGPTLTLHQPNTLQLAPGVVVANNLIYNSGAGGIRYSGDGGIEAPVAFGRIVNNTVYGTQTNDVGIQVDEGAGPTLMNNIVSHTNLGVNVLGARSQTHTVLSGMLFKDNNTDANVGLGGSNIVLTASDPLFVNPATNNFYLAAGSQAIDSSVDNLPDRAALVTVRNPLGILPSPIIAPARDLYGQKRVNEGAPGGQGQNVFKDRGAIDRSDFTGPTSVLVNPQDNDDQDIDQDPASTVVVLSNQSLSNFVIRLIDRFEVDGPAEGSDIDDSRVIIPSVRIDVISGTPRTLTPGIDYTFNYDATNNLIILTPLGGVWPQSQTYRVTLDNSPSGIADRAGNALLPNQLDGSHSYTIFLGTAVDWGDAPDTYGTLGATLPAGPSHIIVAGVRLGVSNGAEADGQPSPFADLDSGDDGVTNINLQTSGQPNSSSVTIDASIAGEIDAWIDLNQDGDFLDATTADGFDAGEFVLKGVDINAGITTLQFTLPVGPRGESIARFRFSTVGNGTGSPHGPALDGEVEDYQVLLVGPEFQNPDNRMDVNNDGHISAVDALLVIDYLNLMVDDVNGNKPLPPQPPNPPLDPTGAGVAGAGRFLDIDGNGFLTAADAILVIDVLNSGAGEGEGEGEGEDSSSAAAFASQSSYGSAGDQESSDSQHSDSLSIPSMLLVSSDIIIEERNTGSSGSQNFDPLWSSRDDRVFDLLAAQAGNDDAAFGEVLGDGEEDLLLGRVEKDSFESLLDDLASDGRS